jgi:hypothetical protein
MDHVAGYLTFVYLPSAITVHGPPWSTPGLVCVECRRHLHFDIPDFGGLPFYIASQVFYEGKFVSDDGTTVLYSLSPRLLMPYSV